MLNEEWYLAYPFYQKAIAALRENCHARPARFDQRAAVRAMFRATRDDQPPWDNHAKSFNSHFAQSLTLAENFSHALQFVIEATLVFTPVFTRVEANVLRSYIRTNPPCSRRRSRRRRTSTRFSFATCGTSST